MSSLTHFSPTIHFYTPDKAIKPLFFLTFGFLTFSGGIKMEHLGEMDEEKQVRKLKKSTEQHIS